jgi:hypothetical protein
LEDGSVWETGDGVFPVSKPITKKHSEILKVVNKEMQFYDIEAGFFAVHGGAVRRNKIYALLSDLVESGDLLRVRQGVYAPVRTS